jgi:DNA-binding transcriptional ArsR family regulator
MLSLPALADPTRRRIVELLASGERASGEIAERFAISAPAVSQHLKNLKQAGLVRSRVEAQRRIYELDPSGFIELDQWLRGIGQFWSSRLDALQKALGDADAKHIGRESAVKRRPKSASRPQSKSPVSGRSRGSRHDR